MVKKTDPDLKSQVYWGRGLVILGVCAILTDLTFLAHPFLRLLSATKEGLYGIVPTIGLSLLQTARAIAFHQVDYFSLVCRILLLFSAAVAVVSGSYKCNAWGSSTVTPNRSSTLVSNKGDR
jgi:hypothetical protein